MIRLGLCVLPVITVIIAESPFADVLFGSVDLLLKVVEALKDRVRQQIMPQRHTHHPETLLLDAPPRYADNSTIIRNILQHHRVGADIHVVADGDPAEHLCSRTYDDIIAERRVALPGLLPRASKRHSLIQCDIRAEDGCFTNDDAHAVIDKESAPDVSCRMNLNTGYETRKRHNDMGQHRNVHAMHSLPSRPSGQTLDDISPRLNLDAFPDEIGRMMFSNQSADRMEDRTPEVLMPMEENPRVKSLKGKERFYLDKEGKPVSKARTYQLRDGLFEAIIDRFYKDPTLAAWGEENRDWGGAFAVYRGLTEALPYNRLFNSPISEGAIVGTAIGYGMCGGRVIAEIMYCDFLGRSGDEIFNQLPKWQAMSGNIIKMPVVIRVSVGSKYGAQHSQDWSSLVAHIPGLKVIFPATPYDAKGLMNSALQGTDPVIFFESQRIYDIGEMFHSGGVPEGYYEIPLGEPDIKKQGSDITILTIGATLYQALKAADILEKNYGMSAEIIDARTLVPFNYEPVIESVRKTGRIVLASDASSRGSFLKEMAQTITELAFDYLDAPPVVVGSRNWIIPAHEMEDYFFPQPSWIVDAIHEKIIPLSGHKSSTDHSPQKTLRLNREGV